MSRAAAAQLAALDAGVDVIDANGGEQQTNVLMMNRSIETRNLDLLRKALVDEVLSDDDLHFAAKQQTLIMTSAARTAIEAIAIGENLIELKQRLSKRAFERFFDEAKGQLLPFGMIAARKYMLIAEAMPRFRHKLGLSFSMDKLPSPSVLYELSVLPDETLLTAFDRGLFEQAATVKRARDFRGELTVAQVREKPVSIASARALRKAKDRLAVLLQRVDEQRALIKELEL